MYSTEHIFIREYPAYQVSYTGLYYGSMEDYMCRMLGFIMFWIAIGMIIALFLASNLFLCICIIIILILAGYNMFCH